MSFSVLRDAQKLDTDPLVELFELDTSMLSNIFGEVGGGAVYRWTPGVLNYRTEGRVTSSSTGLVVADHLVGLQNSALNYTLQVALASGAFSERIRITSWGTTIWDGNAGGAISVSTIGLATALPEVPAIGAVWAVESVGTVFFGGVEYKPVPIEMTGVEWSGKGQLPRPKLTVTNKGGLAAALVIQFGDIVGAKVTRIQTFKSYLDGEATPDASASFEPEVFIVDRKSAHNKTFLEFELAATLDQQGIMLPKRMVLRDACDHSYRQWSTVGGFGHFVYGTCPYVNETFLYKEDGTQTSVPANDLCGKRLPDCLLRFGGDNEKLPFRGFPGVAEVQA